MDGFLVGCRQISFGGAFFNFFMDNVGSWLIIGGFAVAGSALTVATAAGLAGLTVLGTSSLKRKLLGKAMVVGTTVLPESFPVEGVIFETLIKATVSNITATPVIDVNK
jgi:hypothetical protein